MPSLLFQSRYLVQSNLLTHKDWFTLGRYKFTVGQNPSTPRLSTFEGGARQFSTFRSRSLDSIPPSGYSTGSSTPGSWQRPNTFGDRTRHSAFRSNSLESIYSSGYSTGSSTPGSWQRPNIFENRTRQFSASLSSSLESIHSSGDTKAPFTPVFRQGQNTFEGRARLTLLSRGSLHDFNRLGHYQSQGSLELNKNIQPSSYTSHAASQLVSEGVSTVEGVNAVKSQIDSCEEKLNKLEVRVEANSAKFEKMKAERVSARERLEANSAKFEKIKAEFEEMRVERVSAREYLETRKAKMEAELRQDGPVFQIQKKSIPRSLSPNHIIDNQPLSIDKSVVHEENTESNNLSQTHTDDEFFRSDVTLRLNDLRASKSVVHAENTQSDSLSQMPTDEDFVRRINALKDADLSRRVDGLVNGLVNRQVKTDLRKIEKATRELRKSSLVLRKATDEVVKSLTRKKTVFEPGKAALDSGPNFKQAILNFEQAMLEFDQATCTLMEARRHALSNSDAHLFAKVRALNVDQAIQEVSQQPITPGSPVLERAYQQLEVAPNLDNLEKLD